MKKLLLFALVLIFSPSCKKAAGEGGQATITGKIWVEEWNSSFTVHNPANDHYGADYDVYIIYGNDATYGDRVKSGPDGVYEFRYLRTGTYSVYAYSKNATSAGIEAIKIATEISKKKQVVDIGTITVKH